MRMLAARPLSGISLLVVSLLGLSLTACDIPPSFVENSDIDDAMARSAYKTVCKGLEMKDDDTRRYTAMKLKSVEEPIAAECVCEFVVEGKHGWDSAIADGLKGTKRDDLAGCFAEVVKKPDLGKRLEAVVALAMIPAPSARDALNAVAQETGASTEVRVAAIDKGIGGDVKYVDTLLGLMANDSDPQVRAAAAGGLSGMKDDKVVTALKKAYDTDKEGAVRAKALGSIKKSGFAEADALICKAMLEDESPAVRSSAIGAFHATKRKEAIDCLRERALTFEEDGSVRQRLLKALKASPSQDAADVLCDAIPFFLKSYVREALPEKIPGTDIAAIQNDRDWERSYECFQKAYAKRGSYACPGKMYIGHWFRQVGGTAHVPKCPGIE